MAQEKFAVRLSTEDRAQLEGLIRKGQHSARNINRARILLKTNAGWSALQVAAALDTSQRRVFRTRRRYAEAGLDSVLHDRPQANRYRKLDDRCEARLIALACSVRPRARTTGPCVCWPTRWWNWAWCRRCPTRRYRQRLKKHPQALSKTAVVYLLRGCFQRSFRRVLTAGA